MRFGRKEFDPLSVADISINHDPFAISLRAKIRCACSRFRSRGLGLFVEVRKYVRTIMSYGVCRSPVRLS
jgi:hypothetical protein